MRKKLAVWSLAALLLLGLTACSGGDSEDAFTVRVVCESPDVYQIFYTCYLGDEAVGMGGMADLEGGEITEDTDLTLTFPAAYFEDGAVLSQFAMDFSPYGEGDTSEIATTEKIAIPAAYGETYTVVFSGDEASGFQAALQS